MRAHQQLPLCLWSLLNPCAPQQSPQQPARCMWPPRAGRPVNSSWRQRLQHKGGFNNSSVKEEEEELLLITTLLGCWRAKVPDSNMELKPISGSRNQCNTLSQRSVYGLLLKICCDLKHWNSLSQHFLTFRSLSGEYVWVHYCKEQSWQLIDGSKVFCEIWNTGWQSKHADQISQAHLKFLKWEQKFSRYALFGYFSKQ